MNTATPSRSEQESRFVQYLMLRIDPAWRRLDSAERAAGRAEFTAAVCGASAEVTTFAYSTLGLKADADILLWWTATSPDVVQPVLSRVLCSGMGRYCTISQSLWGFTRPSIYTKKHTAQEQAIDADTRLRYLVVYPFAKTNEWYLMSRDARQGMMNEHMRIGHDFEDVRQVLVYATGLDDQEFIVAYETDRLERHQDLVIALRATEARRYTLRDTPIFTAIHYPLDHVLELAG